ncbi:hypothetical protein SLS53_006255 [Cytospora paraplurivora]|uniref:C2H2-type domain-containing protein n=1 Tax=Cytospora paraplurivora TaxID=2898453 RepID=A0AAN9YE63_9PEZI
MSVAYEPRSFHDDSPYAPVGENDHDLNKYINTEANVADMADLAAATYEPANDASSATFGASPSPALDLGPVAPPNVDPANVPVRELSPAIQQGLDSTQPTSTRSKAIAKPNREVTKDESGKYICTWTDCKEPDRKFRRKCEWSKHMDKHERPYVCTVAGCEKIQGFTYSGGLLRHEREVHGKHGGPKKRLLCPHENCKRSSGKGFSRQENLAEHLRRVHTGPGPTLPLQMESPGDNNTDDSASDVASAAFNVMAGLTVSPVNLGHADETGSKRKRSVDDMGREAGGDDGDLHEEVKRLRVENAELRQHVQDQSRQFNEMKAQMQTMQSVLNQFNQTLGLAPSPGP